MSGCLSSLFWSDKNNSESIINKGHPHRYHHDQDHITSHFGSKRLLRICIDSENEWLSWDQDQMLCPMSIKNKNHGKPYAAQLVQTTSDAQEPIEIVPITHHQHHKCDNPYVLLHPSKDRPNEFALTVVYENQIYYLGIDGLTETPQYVAVWKWLVDDDNNSSGDSPVKNEGGGPRKPHKPGKKTKQNTGTEDNKKNTIHHLVITDTTNKWLLQSTKSISDSHHSTIVFSDTFPKNLFDAVFFTAPTKEFIHSYHKIREE